MIVSEGEDDVLFEKVCADLLAEFGIDMKAEIEATSNGRPLRDKGATARWLRDVAASLWRENERKFKETGMWPLPEETSAFIARIKKANNLE